MMMMVMATALSKKPATVVAGSSHFTTSKQSMAFSSLFKGNYFKKGSGEVVPEVVLPGNEVVVADSPASFTDEKRSKMPASTSLKKEIREMERTTDESNLYTIY